MKQDNGELNNKKQDSVTYMGGQQNPGPKTHKMLANRTQDYGADRMNAEWTRTKEQNVGINKIQDCATYMGGQQNPDPKTHTVPAYRTQKDDTNKKTNVELTRTTKQNNEAKNNKTQDYDTSMGGQQN